MKHKPGSLAAPKLLLNGQVRDDGAAVFRECWAEANSLHTHAVRSHPEPIASACLLSREQHGVRE